MVEAFEPAVRFAQAFTPISSRDAFNEMTAALLRQTNRIYSLRAALLTNTDRCAGVAMDAHLIALEVDKA